MKAVFQYGKIYSIEDGWRWRNGDSIIFHWYPSHYRWNDDASLYAWRHCGCASSYCILVCMTMGLAVTMLFALGQS